MEKYKIAVDENILIKDEICAAGSKILYNFKSPYSATAVDKIINAGMTISYKSKISEFGGENEHGGSAVFTVKNKIADAALGIDVDGGSYRSAVKNGLVYIKPTYGTVSRFGIVANVSSVDQIGVYARNLDDGFDVLSVIAGYDKNDGTSYPTEKYNYNADIKDVKSIKLNIDDFKYADELAQVYFIISTAEFSNNISRFDGLKFGYRTENYKNINDLLVNSRSEGFTTETKIKILMGTYVLSENQFKKYYMKAMQIRRLIKQELDKIFTQTDCIIMPVYISEKNNPEEYYNKLKNSALANLSGCPAVIIPTADNRGVQVISKEFGENKLFALGKKLMREGV